MADCPDCGQALAEEERSCGQCGWPHAEETGPSEGGSDAAAATAPAEAGLGWGHVGGGLVVGLVLGFLIGRASAPAPAASEPPRPTRAATPAPAKTAPAPGQLTSDQALRLREVSWKMDQTGQCMGIFEVVSAPPSLRVLRFSAMDSSGKVIAGDRVQASKPIGSRTRLELGFRVKSCDEIAKWRVAVGPGPAPAPAAPTSQPASQPAK